MKIKLVCLLIISAKLSFSQDIHFSQNFIDRVHLNPSLIGEMTKNNYRVSPGTWGAPKRLKKPSLTALLVQLLQTALIS